MKKLTIGLLGKEGAGKSASGNTLLGCHSFHTGAGSNRVTQACSVSFTTVDQQIIEVIDTPGFDDSPQFETKMKPNIINYINQYKPHVFLLVLSIGRFTNEEINTIMDILKGFGDEVTNYMILLFTKGDELENQTIEDYLKESHKDLEKIIQICGGRYHVFNNKEGEDRQQISALLKKINDLVEKNEENHNTNMMHRGEMRQKGEADNSVQKIKDPTENKKGSSCDTDRTEKDRGEPLKELVKLTNELFQKFQDFTKEFTAKMQFMERQLATMQEEVGKTNN